MLSQAPYQWESNTRGAIIIGAAPASSVSSSGRAMPTNSDWANVSHMVLLLLVVFVFDSLSNALRSRLINPAGDR